MCVWITDWLSGEPRDPLPLKNLHRWDRSSFCAILRYPWFLSKIYHWSVQKRCFGQKWLFSPPQDFYSFRERVLPSKKIESNILCFMFHGFWAIVKTAPNCGIIMMVDLNLGCKHPPHRELLGKWMGVEGREEKWHGVTVEIITQITSRRSGQEKWKYMSTFLFSNLWYSEKYIHICKSCVIHSPATLIFIGPDPGPIIGNACH